jgi:hypothetical protein
MHIRILQHYTIEKKRPEKCMTNKTKPKDAFKRLALPTNMQNKGNVRA